MQGSRPLRCSRGSSSGLSSFSYSLPPRAALTPLKWRLLLLFVSCFVFFVSGYPSFLEPGFSWFLICSSRAWISCPPRPQSREVRCCVTNVFCVFAFSPPSPVTAGASSRKRGRIVKNRPRIIADNTDQKRFDSVAGRRASQHASGAVAGTKCPANARTNLQPQNLWTLKDSSGKNQVVHSPPVSGERRSASNCGPIEV